MRRDLTVHRAPVLSAMPQTGCFFFLLFIFSLFEQPAFVFLMTRTHAEIDADVLPAYHIWLNFIGWANILVLTDQ